MQKYKNMQKEILGILAASRESARTAQEYADLLGIKWRQFTRAICSLRRAGYPICAANVDRPYGYWLPPSGSPDVAAYILRFERRNKEQDRTLNALKKYQTENAAGHGDTSKTHS